MPSSKLETRNSLKHAISSGNLALLLDKMPRSTLLKQDPTTQKLCPLARRPRSRPRSRPCSRPSWRNAWEIKSRLSKVTINLIGLEAVEESRRARTRSSRKQPLARGQSHKVHFDKAMLVRAEESVESRRPPLRPVVSLPNLAGLSEEDLEEGDAVWWSNYEVVLKKFAVVLDDDE